MADLEQLGTQLSYMGGIEVDILNLDNHVSPRRFRTTNGLRKEFYIFCTYAGLKGLEFTALDTLKKKIQITHRFPEPILLPV